MADGDDDPLSVIMAALRARLDARVGAAGDVAARLRDLAARYAAAVKADAEAELARRQGKNVPSPTPSPTGIAAKLFEIVAALPELHDDEEEHPGVVETPPRAQSSAVSFRHLMASAENEQPEPRRPSHPEQPHPGVRQLVDDFGRYDLDGLSTPMFKAVAEELAARIRLLQEQGVSDPDDSLAYVMRALTSASYKRGIRNIFSLNQRHQADWQQKIGQARRQREKLDAAPSKPKPIANPKKHDDDDDDHDDDEPREPWNLPRLAARASTGAVVMVGGVVKQVKLDRLREHLGFDVEWLGTATNGMGSTTALERRIREGHVATVVVLEGLISHKHSEQVVDAARQAGVPLAYGGTAGIGKLKAAFEKIEAMA